MGYYPLPMFYSQPPFPIINTYYPPVHWIDVEFPGNSQTYVEHSPLSNPFTTVYGQHTTGDLCLVGGPIFVEKEKLEPQ